MEHIFYANGIFAVVEDLAMVGLRYSHRNLSAILERGSEMMPDSKRRHPKWCP